MIRNFYLPALAMSISLSVACSRNADDSTPTSTGNPASEKLAEQERGLTSQSWCQYSGDSEYPHIKINRFTFTNDRKIKQEIGLKNGLDGLIQFYAYSDAGSKWRFEGEQTGDDVSTVKIEAINGSADSERLYILFDSNQKPQRRLTITTQTNKYPLVAFPCPTSIASSSETGDHLEREIRSLIELTAPGKDRFLAPKSITWPLRSVTLSVDEITNRTWCQPTLSHSGHFYVSLMKFDSNFIEKRTARFDVKDSPRYVRPSVSRSDSDLTGWSEVDGKVVLTPLRKDSRPKHLIFLKSSDGTLFMTDTNAYSYFSRYGLYVPCDSYRSAEGSYIFGFVEWKPISAKDPFQITD